MTKTRWLRLLALGLSGTLMLGGATACAATQDVPPEMSSEDQGDGSASDSSPQADEGGRASNESISERHKGASIEEVPATSRIDVAALKAAVKEEAFVLDVRPASQFAPLSIEGSKNIPAGRVIEIRMDEIPKDEPVYLVDKANERVGEVYLTLVDAGYDADLLNVVEGGIEAWQEAGYKTVAGALKKC